MTDKTQVILCLLVFATLMLWLNLKLKQFLASLLSYVLMWVSVGAAAGVLIAYSLDVLS
jgi:hypothetical protein